MGKNKKRRYTQLVSNFPKRLGFLNQAVTRSKIHPGIGCVCNFGNLFGAQNSPNIFLVIWRRGQYTQNHHLLRWYKEWTRMQPYNKHVLINIDRLLDIFPGRSRRNYMPYCKRTCAGALSSFPAPHVSPSNVSVFYFLVIQLLDNIWQNPAPVS